MFFYIIFFKGLRLLRNKSIHLSNFLGRGIMLKKLAILWLISVTVLIMPNALLAVETDVDVDAGSAARGVIDLVNEELISGDITSIDGFVEGIGSCCKWHDNCLYRYRAIYNAWVHLYIRASNNNGGEEWTEKGKSKTDNNGYYSFGTIKDYCGPVQIKVPSLQHSQAVDYSRDCGTFDSGRELNIKGKYPCKDSKGSAAK